MGKGRLSGTPFHIEYHYVKKRGNKTRCIYYEENGECSNPKCYDYQSWCFGPSRCQHRVKPDTTAGKKASVVKVQNKPEVNKVQVKDRDDLNNCYVIFCDTDNTQIKVYMNGRSYDECPELHKRCFKKEIGYKFIYAECSYEIIDIIKNRVSSDSFEIMQEKRANEKKTVTEINAKDIDKLTGAQYGDYITICNLDTNEISEFMIDMKSIKNSGP